MAPAPPHHPNQPSTFPNPWPPMAWGPPTPPQPVARPTRAISETDHVDDMAKSPTVRGNSCESMTRDLPVNHRSRPVLALGKAVPGGGMHGSRLPRPPTTLDPHNPRPPQSECNNSPVEMYALWGLAGSAGACAHASARGSAQTAVAARPLPPAAPSMGPRRARARVRPAPALKLLGVRARAGAAAAPAARLPMAPARPPPQAAAARAQCSDGCAALVKGPDPRPRCPPGAGILIACRRYCGTARAVLRLLRAQRARVPRGCAVKHGAQRKGAHLAVCHKGGRWRRQRGAG